MRKKRMKNDGHITYDSLGRSDKHILRMNGYDKLPSSLQEKWIDYDFNQTLMGKKLCDFFTWDEYYILLRDLTMMYCFSYRDRMYVIMKDGGARGYQYSFYSEDAEFCLRAKTLDILLEFAAIDGKHISEIYDELLDW